MSSLMLEEWITKQDVSIPSIDDLIDKHLPTDVTDDAIENSGEEASEDCIDTVLDAESIEILRKEGIVPIQCTLAKDSQDDDCCINPDTQQGESTNIGEPVGFRDIFLVDDRDESQNVLEQVRQILNDSEGTVVTRVEHAQKKFISDYKTPFFLALAFPWLYPYGRGCPGEGSEIKVDKHYFRHTLKYGGDRSFQKCSTFIFYAYSWIMKSAVGTISSVVSKRQQDSLINAMMGKGSANGDIGMPSSDSPVEGRRDVPKGLTKEQLDYLRQYLNGDGDHESSMISLGEVKVLIQRLIPYSKDIKGSSMFFQREKRNLLSMITSPSTITLGEWRLFFTEAQASIYLPEIYDNIVTSAGM